MKAPLPLIKDRGAKTYLVMSQILPVYNAPGFMSPNNYNDLVVGVTAQEDLLGLKEAAQAIAAGDLDGTLSTWHTDSVLTLKVGRVTFGPTTKGPAWRNLTANGGGRERIIKEGKDLVAAWEKSDTLWVPKPGKTLAAFEALDTAAGTKLNVFNLAEKDASVERGMLWYKAEAVWELSVQWYEMAAAAFGPETPEGVLIRTIPTSYNPNEVPGLLTFPQHYSPAPNQVKLVWHSPRGEHFDIYAKAPGALEFTKILENVTQTSWMGEGLNAGDWTFKGEARNASGLGEMSAPITVPIQAAQAA